VGKEKEAAHLAKLEEPVRTTSSELKECGMHFKDRSCATPLMVSWGNRRVKMGKLYTSNNNPESRTNNTNIVPDRNQHLHVSNHPSMSNRGINRGNKPNINTKNPNILFHQPHRLDVSCIDYRRKTMDHVLRNLLSTSYHISIHPKTIKNIIY
jgi:hypothetical protein